MNSCILIILIFKMPDILVNIQEFMPGGQKAKNTVPKNVNCTQF